MVFEQTKVINPKFFHKIVIIKFTIMGYIEPDFLAIHYWL